MKLVILIGPQAVGKMTVGQELAKQTGLKLLHNHMTIDLVSPFFDYGTDEGRRLVQLFRHELFEAVAKSDQPGLIFTFVWAFDMEEDRTYIEGVAELFESHGADVYYVELEADIEERLARNTTENRLAHKPTKRDIAWSEAELKQTATLYRLNSRDGEIDVDNYLRINNTDLDAETVARQIQRQFNL
ncbi:shikimate kinase [Exiguobacterium sp. SH3S2]|uniref:AAA family ATPase n=1 Tax=Exiguobacterium TaxID=33986 RepID=UPI000877A151|nr:MULTISPECIES: AAA family ATPase [Exiguobacterium]OGX79747.1 shikimate kinase [Exiguobacterium sp. SH31]TCI46163.1 shikimate kinase [Exiguobacterium sp. SH3S3]TCI57368.1 shikimate kinase [Exiguobacterium sp. SH1S21]TCI61251.1 shikimate kinase [Exiguobacterium sp. SH3S2]TCI64027.1 shikimate kinase [Exiguobacterium sp. SH3S1]